MTRVSKIKSLGLSVPKRAEVIKDTILTAMTIACLSTAIFGIDSVIVGIMALVSRMS